MEAKLFVYTLNSRVVWWGREIQNIPVIAEVYRVHRVTSPANSETENCMNYVVKSFFKFENELILTPVSEMEIEVVKIVHTKIKIYMQLNEYINFAYKMDFPAVFDGEKNRIDILSKSLVDYSTLDEESVKAHELFVSQLVEDRKNELKSRYLKIVHEIKTAQTLDELKKISNTVVFEGINFF